MTATILRADAAHLPIPDATVDLIVTSPPYFGLRSYTDGGEHYEGQVGDEATPAEYLDALIACTAEWMRVLKPGGSIFVNLGDKYAGMRQPRPARRRRRTQPGRYIAPTDIAAHWTAGSSATKSLMRPAVALRHPLHRRARPDPPRRDRVVEAERAAGVGDGSGAPLA
jgi:hypothetical protein